MNLNNLITSKQEILITDEILQKAGTKGDPIAVALKPYIDENTHLIQTDINNKTTAIMRIDGWQAEHVFALSNNLHHWWTQNRHNHAPIIGSLRFHTPKHQTIPWIDFKPGNQYIGLEGLIRTIALETGLQRSVARSINCHTNRNREDTPEHRVIDTIQQLLEHGIEAFNWQNLMYFSGCHAFVQQHMIDIEQFLEEYTQRTHDDLTYHIRPSSGLLFTQIAHFTFEETAREIAGYLGALDEAGQVIT